MGGESALHLPAPQDYRSKYELQKPQELWTRPGGCFCRSYNPGAFCFNDVDRIKLAVAQGLQQRWFIGAMSAVSYVRSGGNG